MTEYRSLPVDSILVNDNIRKTFDAEQLNELAASLKEYGVLQPLVVRPLEGEWGCDYVLVAGERRLRAANERADKAEAITCRECANERVAKAERERDEADRLLEHEKHEVKRWQSLSNAMEEEAIKTAKERDSLRAQVEDLQEEVADCHKALDAVGVTKGESFARYNVFGRVESLIQIHNTATAQVEMLAEVLEECLVWLAACHPMKPDEPCVVYQAWRAGERLLKALPTAGERWSKMQAVCKAAKVAVSMAPVDSGFAEGMFNLRQALVELDKVVGS